MNEAFHLQPMRRKARAFSPAECLALLHRGEWGVLSLAADGFPYAVPLNYTLIPPTGTSGISASAERADPPFPAGWGLVFHCAEAGLKSDLLTTHPQACFTVVPTAHIHEAGMTTRYESVIVFGTARRLHGTEKDEALRLLGLRFSADYPEELEQALRKSGPKTAVWRLDMTGVTGKFNPGT